MVAAALTLAPTALVARRQPVCRAQRPRAMVVRAQAATATVEFKGEIKDKVAETAINGGLEGCRGAGGCSRTCCTRAAVAAAAAGALPRQAAAPTAGLVAGLWVPGPDVPPNWPTPPCSYPLPVH